MGSQFGNLYVDFIKNKISHFEICVKLPYVARMVISQRVLNFWVRNWYGYVGNVWNLLFVTFKVSM